MVSHHVDFRASFAQAPVANLLNEFRTFFQNCLVGSLVHVVNSEAGLFQGIKHLIGAEIAGCRRILQLKQREQQEKDERPRISSDL